MKKLEVTQTSVIKLKSGEVVAGLTLNIYNENGSLKANNYKVSIRLEQDDPIIDEIDELSNKLLALVEDKILQ